VLFAILDFLFSSEHNIAQPNTNFTFAAGKEPASSNVGEFPPLSFKELAAKKALTGGPITAAGSVNAGGMAPGFSTQFCDVEVDPETGKVTILRFVAAQDVGCAIHPSYVEGQIQCRGPNPV
jgi:CO/xanthine dehydrogenase Mo-binding subunit